MQLLRLGAYQLLFMDRVPESAAVNESVRLAKALFKNEKITGFVNALLRSVIRSEGVTAIVATHDPMMLDVADRVVELHDGRLIV